jgi:dephospho-CoA kinase
VILVGLAGGLGSGKSTVGKALAARGAVVIDADLVARDVVAPGSAGEEAVLDHFGTGVQRPDGHLDRAALAAIVFADSTERLALEAITHPLIRAEIDTRVASFAAKEPDGAARTTATPLVVVIELPLLDRRRQQEYRFDVVVVVDAPEDVAVQRAVRRGMSEADARARLAAQPAAAERLALADRDLVNDGDLEHLERAVDELWAWLVVQPSSPAGQASGHGA